MLSINPTLLMFTQKSCQSHQVSMFGTIRSVDVYCLIPGLYCPPKVWLHTWWGNNERSNVIEFPICGSSTTVGFPSWPFYCPLSKSKSTTNSSASPPPPSLAEVWRWRWFNVSLLNSGAAGQWQRQPRPAIRLVIPPKPTS